MDTKMGRRARFPIRKFTNLKEMKAEEYDYWRQRPDYERIAAVSELTLELYRLKDPTLDVSRMQKTLVRMKRESSASDSEPMRQQL